MNPIKSSVFAKICAKLIDPKSIKSYGTFARLTVNNETVTILATDGHAIYKYETKAEAWPDMDLKLDSKTLKALSASKAEFLAFIDSPDTYRLTIGETSYRVHNCKDSKYPKTNHIFNTEFKASHDQLILNSTLLGVVSAFPHETALTLTFSEDMTKFASKDHGTLIICNMTGPDND